MNATLTKEGNAKKIVTDDLSKNKWITNHYFWSKLVVAAVQQNV